MQRLRPNRNGHLFFELSEKGTADEIVGKLDAVIWRRDLARVQRALQQSGQEIVDGQELRCRADLDFYAPFGRTQLVVREIDLVFALGKLAARRQETLAALTTAGLVERNRSLELSPHPLELALVTSRGSAAYHDFLETLRESGYRFRVTLIDAAVQGKDAERAIGSGLAAASALEIDACVLIRGGGSKTDLAAFDSRRVAEAVARSRVPVLTGLGHQIDESIADRVAHTAFKTPTKVAEFLVDRVEAADGSRSVLEKALTTAVRGRLEAARERIAAGSRRAVVARLRLATATARVHELGSYLARCASRLPASRRSALDRLESDLARWVPRLLAVRGDRIERTAVALSRVATERLRARRMELEAHSRVAAQLGPERVLARGFSITRDEEGRAVRRAAEIRYGQTLTTQLAQGTVRSRVEE